MVSDTKASRLSSIQLTVNSVSRVVGVLTPCISFVVLLRI